MRASARHHVSAICEGEVCRICKDPASHKVEEVIFPDDPKPVRHPYVAYLCCEDFAHVMGGAVQCMLSEDPWICDDCQTENPSGAQWCKKCSPMEFKKSEEQTLQDILGLVLPRVPTSSVIEEWTDEQREQALEWAGATHVKASDNDDVVVPPMPAFLKKYATPPEGVDAALWPSAQKVD